MPTHIKDALFLVMDTETTGSRYYHDVPVEVAFVLTDMRKALASGHTLVNPGDVLVSNEARAVHHIDPATLSIAPFLKDALMGFAAEIKRATDAPVAAYVAHFAEFDSAMLPLLTKAPWLCTYLLARKLYPNLSCHKNQFLRYELELDVPEAEGLPAHRAMADTHVTAALLRHMLQTILTRKDLPHTVEGLIEWSHEPILLRDVLFGKHYGKTWEWVANNDPGYLEWMIKPKPNQKELDPDLKLTLDHWLGLLKAARSSQSKR